MFFFFFFECKDLLTLVKKTFSQWQFIKIITKVVQAVGEPIMGHGETTSRGRRRNVRYDVTSTLYVLLLTLPLKGKHIHVENCT